MKKIGITGSLASGKTTASIILSKKKGPLFSADDVVSKLYKNNNFKKKIAKQFKVTNFKNIKKIIKNKILSNRSNIKKIEKILHPIVRKKMNIFCLNNKRKKFAFFEIPLLVESNLMKNFDVIFYIKAKKSIRLKRFEVKGGDKSLFEILDKKQLKDSKKIKYCDHIVVNEKNINILKKKLLSIFNKYE